MGPLSPSSPTLVATLSVPSFPVEPRPVPAVTQHPLVRDIVFEFWLRAYNCNEEAGFVRYIIPSVKFTPGGNTETFGNAATLRRFTGTAKPNTNISPTGPWGDLPAGVALTGNSPVYFYESALPAGVDADQCTYLPWDFAPSV